jgi:hypothetical protein
MSDETFMTVGIIIALIAALLIGIAIGAAIGSDSIANKWCVSLEYDEGHYSKLFGMPGEIVCAYMLPVRLEKEGE